MQEQSTTIDLMLSLTIIHMVATLLEQVLELQVNLILKVQDK